MYAARRAPNRSRVAQPPARVPCCGPRMHRRVRRGPATLHGCRARAPKYRSAGVRLLPSVPDRYTSIEDVYATAAFVRAIYFVLLSIYRNGMLQTCCRCRSACVLTVLFNRQGIDIY
ncbi:hypothetical protein BCAR13_730035 [Paraburkholderia caribensis]|nr:hypothetical protein BCAR13_730035 [Paraburkholderia caribensis]